MAKLFGPLPGVPARRTETIYSSNVFGAKSAGVLPNEGDQTDSEVKDRPGMSDIDIIEEARERLDYVESRDADNRNRAQEMLRFCYRRGSQWPDRVRRERESDNRPVLEFNQMPAFINQVVNDERQNRPAIKVRGASDDATVEMAEIRQDLIRHIEYESGADGSYDQAFRYAVAANVGYWRIVTDWDAEDSFDQKIQIKPINDIFSVYYDPDCVEPDGSDCQWCLVTEELKPEEFERRYPNAAPIDWQNTDPALNSWISGDGVRIADYLHKVYFQDTLLKLGNGQSVWKSEAEPDDPEMVAPLYPMGKAPTTYGGAEVVDDRDVDRCEVQWHVLNGVEVLEEHKWAGKYIPVVPVFGDVTRVDGETIRQSLVERAQDAQQMFNFWTTTAAEAAAMQPKTPFLLANGQIANNDDAKKWGQANTKPFAYLGYDRYDESGKDLGVPARSSPDVDVSGMLNQAQICLQNMRQVIGIADPLQQLTAQDESGRAILAKERMSNTATFHFVDNLSRAIRYTGKVILDLIPSIYDTQRTLQLLREDGTQYKTTVNQAQPANTMGQAQPTLQDLTTGEYDVIVDAGPSYASKRAEFVNSVMEAAQSYQGLWPAAGDLLVKNMDWPGADDVSDSLLALAPPQIQALRAQKSQDPLVVSLSQQMQQMQQQNQQQLQALQQQMSQLGQENQKLTMENYTVKAQAAASAAQAKEQQSMVGVKMIEAQNDLREQQLESQDVMTQAQTDRLELGHKITMDEKDYGLQVMDRVIALLTLQQKQMQPVGPEAAQLNTEIQPPLKADQG